MGRRDLTVSPQKYAGKSCAAAAVFADWVRVCVCACTPLVSHLSSMGVATQNVDKRRHPPLYAADYIPSGLAEGCSCYCFFSMKQYYRLLATIDRARQAPVRFTQGTRATLPLRRSVVSALIRHARCLYNKQLRYVPQYALTCTRWLTDCLGTNISNSSPITLPRAT